MINQRVAKVIILFRFVTSFYKKIQEKEDFIIGSVACFFEFMFQNEFSENPTCSSYPPTKPRRISPSGILL